MGQHSHFLRCFVYLSYLFIVFAIASRDGGEALAFCSFLQLVQLVVNNF